MNWSENRSEKQHGTSGFDRDRVLVEGCLRQDPAAWEMMVQSHGRQIFRLCYRYTGRRDEAEDLMQEVFLRVYQNLDSFNADLGCFQSWILRVGKNLVIDYHRHSRRFQASRELDELSLAELEDAGATSPYNATEWSEHSSIVRDRLAMLPEEVQEALTLRELQGLSYEEISRRLGVPVGTIKSRVSRGRTKLASSIRRARSRQGLKSLR